MECEGGTPELVATLAAHADAVAHVAGYMSVRLGECLDGFIQVDRLRTVWTSLATLAGALADALADVFVENSGILRLDTLATGIETEANRVTQVRTKADVCHHPRVVIANANALQLVDELAPDAPWPNDHVDGIHDMTVGLSAAQVWLGVDADPSPLCGGVAEISVSTTWDAVDGFSYATDGVPEKVNIAIVNYSMLDRTAALAAPGFLPHEFLSNFGHDTDTENVSGVRAAVRMGGRWNAAAARAMFGEVSMETASFLEVFRSRPRGSSGGYHNIFRFLCHKCADSTIINTNRLRSGICRRRRAAGKAGTSVEHLNLE